MGTLCLRSSVNLANSNKSVESGTCQSSTTYQVSGPSLPGITYNLRDGNQNSDTFYTILRDFSTECMDQIISIAETILHQYGYFVTEDRKEIPRSMGEYAVELLTLGITWKRYSNAAMHSSYCVISCLSNLYKLRQKYSGLKRYIDPVRGFSTSRFLTDKLRHSATGKATVCLKNFERFILWLDATGEFKDEVKRFVNWKSFFHTLTADEASSYINKAILIADWFEYQAQNRLGNFTAGVPEFLAAKHPSYRGREDELFCGKYEVEYFANMVASELMNLGLHERFKQTDARVVLVPGCMKSQPENQCKASREGMDIMCTGCTKECNIYRITQLGKAQNFKTCIVPHSSRFTQWLKQYENTTEYGVVAVACPLNIAVGGYEMRELNIPSQCVMLDFCGCKKHWDDLGIPTDVNDNQILKAVRS